MRASPRTDAGAAGACDNLILVSTGYHLILAHLVACDPRWAGRSVLVFTGTREQVAAFHQAMREAGGAPFDEVALVPLFPVGAKPARERQRWRALAALEARLRPARLVLFNDSNPDVQALARRVARRGGEVLCGEDGGCAYSARSWAQPWRRQLARALYFGPWVENPTVPGTTRAVHAFLAVYPERVRPELRRRPVLGLDPARLPDLARAPWVERLCAALGLAPADLVCVELYAPTYSGALRDREGLRTVLRERLRAALGAGRACAVKYHPRERGDFLGAAALGAHVLPPALPVELVYQASGRALRTVVGDTGTTLLSARWLAPGAQALSALRYTGIADPYYEAVLERLGVTLL